ncbi:hypothetical protein GOODEAATRI_032136, partial [Goodea atripinnis]
KAMPVSLLWAVDAYGRVYCLSTVGQQWEQSRNAQMEFKRVTAAQLCCWGIACDNNIYLNVHASDLPIRYQEHTFENQGWTYAMDFPATYTKAKKWNSCVRRRRWLRYRRYNAMDTWAKVVKESKPPPPALVSLIGINAQLAYVESRK